MVNKFGKIVLLTILAANAVAPLASAQTLQQPSSEVATKTAGPIALNVTVTDKKGGFVMGLQPENFEVSIDKKPAHVVSVSQTDSPISIGILFDSSSSMSIGAVKGAARNFGAFKEALRRFMEASNKSNDYFILGFNIKPQVLVDWTADPLTYIDKLSELQTGNTAMYDACYLAVDKVQHGHHARRALLLVSDGQDNFSHYTFIELRELLRQSDVLLYSIDFRSTTLFGSGLAMEGEAILNELSFVSGGRLFSDRNGAGIGVKDAKEVFEIIATELRNQYTLSIVPKEPLAGRKWRKIKAKVNPPPDAPLQLKNLQARTREGVYAQ